MGVIRLRNGGSDCADQPYRIWQDAAIVLAEEAISASPGGNKSARTRRRGKTDTEDAPRPSMPGAGTGTLAGRSGQYVTIAPEALAYGPEHLRLRV